MKLERKNNYNEEYTCDLTKELDEVSGILNNQHYNLFYHYILADKWCREEKCLAIRVPGGTVGGIWIDNNVITDIIIDRNYVVKTYPKNVNELMKKYIGVVVEYKKEND